jgi:hypothetical protein
MAGRPVVLKIKKGGIFVNAEKNTDDDEEEEHTGTVTYNDDETLAEYKYPPEGVVVQYFKKQDDGVAWKRYLDGKDGDFDNNDGVDNIFKFEDPTGSGAAAAWPRPPPPPPPPPLLRQNAMLQRHRPVGADGRQHPLLAEPGVPLGNEMDVDETDGGSRKKSKKSKSKKSKRKTKGGKKQKKQSKSRKQRR